MTQKTTQQSSETVMWSFSFLSYAVFVLSVKDIPLWVGVRFS